MEPKKNIRVTIFSGSGRSRQEEIGCLGLLICKQAIVPTSGW